MNHTEKRTETVTREVVVKITCDWCNEEIKLGSYERFDSEFVAAVGECYPSGGDHTRFRSEFCQHCSEKLIALMRTNGIVVIETEEDY